MFVCSAFTCLLLTLALLLLHNYVDAVEAAGNAPAAAWAEATTPPPAVLETTGRHGTLALWRWQRSPLAGITVQPNKTGKFPCRYSFSHHPLSLTLCFFLSSFADGYQAAGVRLKSRSRARAASGRVGVGANSFGRGRVWPWTGGAVEGDDPRRRRSGMGTGTWTGRDEDGDGVRGGDEEDRVRQTEKVSSLVTTPFFHHSLSLTLFFFLSSFAYGCQATGGRLERRPRAGAVSGRIGVGADRFGYRRVWPWTEWPLEGTARGDDGR